MLRSRRFLLHSPTFLCAMTYQMLVNSSFMRAKLGQTHFFRAEVLDLETVKGCSSGKRHVRLTLFENLAEVDFDPVEGCDHPSADTSTDELRESCLL